MTENQNNTVSETYIVCDVCGCHDEGNLVDIHPLNADPVLLCEHCAREHYARGYDGSWFDMRVYSMRIDPVSSPTRHSGRGDGPFYRGPLFLYRHGVFIPSFEYNMAVQRWCERCNTVHYLSELMTVHLPVDPTRPWGAVDSLDICSDCLSELTARTDLVFCDECEDFSPAAVMSVTAAGNSICHSCLDDHYTTCGSCGEIYHSDDTRWSDTTGTYCCPGCINSLSDDDDADEDDGETSLIHPYGYTPRLDFCKTADEHRKVLYIGVENETSHDTGADREEHSECIERVLNPYESESPFYQKCDSSLHKGIELVSMPMSLSYWHEEVRASLEEYFDEATEYITEGGSDGLHVHLSRKGMNLGHRIKFGAFFELCRYEVEKCARRKSYHYAAFLPDDRMNCCWSSKTFIRAMQDYASERMRCVNWTNANTLEVRVFRSAHNVTDYMAAIELCHAVYQFTKRISWRKLWALGKDYMLWDAFLTAIADDRRYIDLFTQLEGLGYEQFLPSEQAIVHICSTGRGALNNNSASDNYEYEIEEQVCNF